MYVRGGHIILEMVSMIDFNTKISSLYCLETNFHLNLTRDLIF